MALAWAWLGSALALGGDPNGSVPVVIQPGASLGFRPCSKQPPVASPGAAEWRPTLFAETYAGNSGAEIFKFGMWLGVGRRGFVAYGVRMNPSM